MKKKDNHDFSPAEAATDQPHPVDKQIVLTLINAEIDQLEEQEAQLICEQERVLLAQQSYELDDFLVDPGQEERMAFDSFVLTGITTAQLAHTLKILEDLRKKVSSL